MQESAEKKQEVFRADATAQRKVIREIRSAGAKKSSEEWRDFRIKCADTERQVGGGATFEERVRRNAQNKHEQSVAEARKQAQAIRNTIACGIAKSASDWEQFRARLDDPAEQLGGGISFDERVRQGMEEKQNAFKAESRKQMKLIKEAQAKGFERSAVDWQEFRDQLAVANAGMSFEERVQQSLQEKLETSKTEAAAQRKRIRETKELGYAKSQDDWRKFRSGLTESQNYDAVLTEKIAAKKDDWAASARAYKEVLTEIANKLEDRPLLMEQEAQEKRFKDAGAKKALEMKSKPTRQSLIAPCSRSSFLQPELNRF
jgi:hypothetical protein